MTAQRNQSVDPRARQYRQPVYLKIEASRCTVRVGDRVAPETKIGVDYETDRIVTAGCHGEVVAVTFSGGEHALTVAIRADSGWPD